MVVKSSGIQVQKHTKYNHDSAASGTAEEFMWHCNFENSIGDFFLNEDFQIIFMLLAVQYTPCSNRESIIANI